MDAIVNKPNRVLEKQRLLQASHVPVYLRGPRSRAYFSLYVVGWVAGLAGSAVGVYALIQGKPSA